MSKERELLKEFIDFVDSYEFYPTERSVIWEIVSRTQEILAKPEQTKQEPKGYVIYKPEGSEEEEIIPLYTAPQKRKPLSDGATADMYHANKKATHPDSYWSGVYDAEKAHGIGDDR